MPGQNRFGVRDLAAPWYAGVSSFARSRWVEPSEVPQGSIGIVGMPFDEYATTGGRTGMRHGPRAIRVASLRAVRYYAFQTDVGLLNIFDGRVTGWPAELPIVDSGDVPVIPADRDAQLREAVAHVREVARRAALTVTLGGDHYVAYPACRGVLEACKERKPDFRLAHIHLDSHTDFRDDGMYTGPHNQGTCVRRIAEMDGVAKVAWLGLNTASEPNQFREMQRQGFKAYTSHYVNRVGVKSAVAEALDYATSGVDGVYISVDIDIVTGADAPGTAAPVFDGISAPDLLAMLALLGESEKIVGLDMCEVDPEYDPTGRTDYLAAQGILSVLGTRMFPLVVEIPPGELASVFIRGGGTFGGSWPDVFPRVRGLPAVGFECRGRCKEFSLTGLAGCTSGASRSSPVVTVARRCTQSRFRYTL